MNKKRIILIDPGHGAETPGKRSPDGTLREYEFNRDVARRLRKKLHDSGIDARLTVTDDKDIPLIQRTNQARVYKQQGYEVLLVSIHANAAGNGWGPAHGIETFTNDQAKKLTEMIQRYLVAETGLRDRGVKQADLHITRETARYGIPGLLAELGFMTNREESALLKTDAYREKCATALAKAIREYCGTKYVELTDNPQDIVDNWCMVELNGKSLPLTGILKDGKSLIPVRRFAELIGKGDLVGWCDSAKKIILAGKVLESSEVISGIGLAWSKEIAAVLELTIEWDEKRKTVILKGCV